MNKKELIQQLSSNLKPTPTLWPLNLVLATWIVVSLVYVGGLFLILGPLRPGVGTQLLNHPSFTLEMLAGLAAFGCLTLSAFRSAIPGVPTKGLIRAGFLLGAVWISHILLGLIHPILEPSMLGKREHCALEAYLYSAPPALVAIWLLRHRYPLNLVRTSVLVAIAAGLLPAIAMQIACMYEPVHILKFHVFPIFILTVIVACGALVGRLFKKVT